MFITLGEVSTPSAGMIVVITLAAVLTAVSLILRFALLWSAQRELAGMLTNWMSGSTAMPSSDRVVRMGRIEQDVVLNRILSMGIYDWKDTDKQGGRSCPVMSIRYAAVLGNQLLQKIKRGNDKVGLLPKNRGSILTIHLLFTAGPNRVQRV